MTKLYTFSLIEIAKLSSIAESQTGSIGILTDQFKQDLFQKKLL